jgi:hypothetical protein
MKNIYKYIGLLVIMVFSFYYTDKIALMVQNNNPIMQKINEVKETNDVDYVNAIIDDDKIIPGKNGLSINIEKSFSVMKSFGAFNSYYLVYDQKKPDVSLEDNKDKIIYSGNLTNKNISLIVEYNENTISYLENNKIKSDVLVNKDNYMNINYLELINNDFNNYNEVEIILNRSKLNNNLCLVSDKSNLEFCKKRNKYLIDSDLILTNDNLISVKNSIKNGSIIIVKSETSLDNLKIIIDQAKFKGLNFVYLSKLISEENSN